jgi:predicted metal-dependent enzyme (double-stranded beta helix superfamily)
MPDKKTFAITRRMLFAGAAAAASAPLAASRVDAKPTAKQGAGKMDLDRFIDDCIKANLDADPQLAVREVLKRGVSDPDAMLAAVGEPTSAGLAVFHHSKSLTIFSATWTPQMNLMPHNHLMWALIGIYTGREDNILWRPAEETIEAYGVEALFEGDVATLPADVIHSVTNPLERFTGGVHIYGGDFFDTTRSQWNPETLEQEPSDGAAIQKIFAHANERAARCPVL